MKSMTPWRRSSPGTWHLWMNSAECSWYGQQDDNLQLPFRKSVVYLTLLVKSLRITCGIVHSSLMCLFRQFRLPLAKLSKPQKWLDSLLRSSQGSWEPDWQRCVNVHVSHHSLLLPSAGISACLANARLPFSADGPRCHRGKAAERRVHATENGNPHSPEKTRREGGVTRSSVMHFNEFTRDWLCKFDQELQHLNVCLKASVTLCSFCFLTADCRRWGISLWKRYSHSQPVWESDSKLRWAPRYACTNALIGCFVQPIPPPLSFRFWRQNYGFSKFRSENQCIGTLQNTHFNLRGEESNVPTDFWNCK